MYHCLLARLWQIIAKNLLIILFFYSQILSSCIILTKGSSLLPNYSYLCSIYKHYLIGELIAVNLDAFVKMLAT